MTLKGLNGRITNQYSVTIVVKAESTIMKAFRGAGIFH